MTKTLLLLLVFGATFALVQALYVLFVLVRGDRRAIPRLLDRVRRKRWL